MVNSDHSIQVVDILKEFLRESVTATELYPRHHYLQLYNYIPSQMKFIGLSEFAIEVIT